MLLCTQIFINNLTLYPHFNEKTTINEKYLNESNEINRKNILKNI